LKYSQVAKNIRISKFEFVRNLKFLYETMKILILNKIIYIFGNYKSKKMAELGQGYYAFIVSEKISKIKLPNTENCF